MQEELTQCSIFEKVSVVPKQLPRKEILQQLIQDTADSSVSKVQHTVEGW